MDQQVQMVQVVIMANQDYLEHQVQVVAQVLWVQVVFLELVV